MALDRRGWPSLGKVFRLPRTRRRIRQEIDDELRFHLEERAEELMAAGMARADAEAEARRRFGDVEAHRRETASIDQRIIQERERMDTWDAIRRETRQAVRSLARSRGFSTIAVTTLALGIGATTAIFTILDAVVLRPLPYPAAERLVYLQSGVPGVGPDTRWGLSVAGYLYFREHARGMDALGAYTTGQPAFGGRDGAERVSAARVSGSLFDVLGARTILGRPIRNEDNLRGTDPVVVLGHDFWQNYFDSDAAIVGRTIQLNSSPVEVIGVLAPGVHLPQTRIDVWLAAGIDPAAPPVNSHYLSAIGRLREGVTVAAARDELARLTSQFPEVFPGAYSPSFMESSGFATEIQPLHERVIGNYDRILWILLGAVSLVLLIACANVANLFLVRTETRRRELAVRTALGGDRAHLAWHYLTESVVLALVAGGIGLLLAYGLVRALLALAPSGIPRLDEIGLGWGSVAFAVALSLLAGITFGLFPLVRLGRSFDALRDASRGMTASRGQRAARGALVVSQVALAMVLLAAAGLMLRSFDRLRNVRPGLEPEGVLTMGVSLPASRYRDYNSVSRFYKELTDRIAALPGVTSVALGPLPLDGDGSNALGGWRGCSLAFTDEPPSSSGEQGSCVGTHLASPGYFETLGIPVEGRTPTWDETDRGMAGAVVTRALAERLWPGQNPLGRGIKGNGSQPPYYTVVGVIGDLRAAGLDQPPVAVVFYPIVPMEGAPLWTPPRSMTLAVRTTHADPALLTPAIRRTMSELDSEIPIANVRTMEQVMARSMSRTSFTMLLLGAAGVMSLLLSAVGIYGVISYTVSQRRGEIGIRMALGARTAQVAGLVVAQSVRLAALGVAIGLVAAFSAASLLESLLFDVSATDPVTLVAVAVMLLALSVAASYAPARRAAAVNPSEALRAD